MPVANSQNRAPLHHTAKQARSMTVASMVCAQVLLVSASAAIEADAEPDTYVVNTASASVTMTLPPLADVPVGRKLSFWKGSSASNSMVVDGYASETIEGSANVTRTARYAVITVEKVQLTAGSTPTYGWMLSKADSATGGIDSAQIADGAIDLVHMSADSVDSDQYVDASVDPIHMSTTAITPAADGAVAILNTTTEINLTVTAAGTVVISTSSSAPGQEILLRAVAVSGGGAYTLVTVGGTLTLNSTGETAKVKRNAANNAWLVVSLSSQVAAGALATVV
jgi:hypothetical protein